MKFTIDLSGTTSEGAPDFSGSGEIDGPTLRDLFALAIVAGNPTVLHHVNHNGERTRLQRDFAERVWEQADLLVKARSK